MREFVSHRRVDRAHSTFSSSLQISPRQHTSSSQDAASKKWADMQVLRSHRIVRSYRCWDCNPQVHTHHSPDDTGFPPRRALVVGARLSFWRWFHASPEWFAYIRTITIKTGTGPPHGSMTAHTHRSRNAHQNGLSRRALLATRSLPPNRVLANPSVGGSC